MHGAGVANMTANVIDGTAAVLDGERLAAMVGEDPAALPAASLCVLASAELHYEVLRGDEREACLLRALRGSEVADLRRAGPHRAADWERGWAENLREYEATGGSAGLVPKYNHHRVLRLCGDYVRAADTGFEYAVYTAIRHCLFARWFGGLERVVEYGCGTGTSLHLLAEQFPRLRLCGLDWAPSSQQIVARLAERLGRPIEARRLDMFAPDADIALGRGTGVFTSAALEQLGADHGALLDHLLAREPELCVHLEPIHEFYDAEALFDDVARRYHTARNYLRGFLTRLQALAAQGRVEILAQRRTGLGSFFHEGYGIVVWRPRRGPGAGR
jgi:hypothetical protein